MIITTEIYKSIINYYDYDKYFTFLMCYRKEHLKLSDWKRIIVEKSLSPISIDEAYNVIIFEQYNLHLIDRKRFEKSAKWSYEWT